MNKTGKQFICLCFLMTTFAVSIKAQYTAGSSITSRTNLQASGSKAIEQRVYDNGLGDIVQEVQSYPGSSLKSVVVHHEYDELRRKTKTWLPVYSSSGSDFVNIKNLANTQYKKESAPFSRTEYDDFLLSQPSAQYKAGAKWQDNNKKVSVTYSEYEDYYMFEDFEAGEITMPYKKTVYLCTKTVDEDGCISAEYTDLNGKLLISETSQGKTYYVYNPKGDLAYVLPPAISKIIIEKCKPSTGRNMYISETDENTDEQIRSGIKKYAYIYRYDYQRHCIYKKLPGCDPIYYIYDKAGNCILTQDGNQRKNKVWMYSIPDKLGRPCISGICHNSLSYTKEPLHSVFVYAEYDGTSTQRGGYAVRNLTLKSDTLYTAAYYDNYSFIGKHGVPSTLKSSSESGFKINSSLGHGLQTGSATAILKDTGVAGYMYSAMYYDSRYNLAQVRTKNHLGNTETTHTSYTFTGKPSNVVIRREQRKLGDYERYKYTYDSADRLKSVKHMFDGASEKTLQTNSYDNLGRLWRVNSGNSGNLSTTYTYDIHSWLTNIKTVTYSNQSDVFEEKLIYADHPTQPCYNGNISVMKWKTTSDSNYKQYDFKYDNASRLLSATYSEANSSDKKFSTQYKYNSMGNITSIKRHGLQDGGTYGLIDDLTLSYSGNRLVKVKDAVSDPTYKNAWNFMDGASPSTGNEYVYDKNGNVIKDLNKGIENIVYNTLNLPSLIKLTDGRSIKYTYSADGRKLRAEYITTTPATTKKMDYLGNMIYEDSKPKQLNVEGGYIPLDDMSMTYRFYVKDHLGNNRMAIHEPTQSVEQVNDYYPYGGQMSSSTGWNAQRYKYNGKEFDRMHGLDWYDYGARWMDPALGRWHSMDPLCEKYYDVSPYAYCLNNPIKAIDPDGRYVAYFDGNDKEWIYNSEEQAFFCGDVKFEGDNEDLSSLTKALNTLYGTCDEMTSVIDDKKNGVEIGIHNKGREANGEGVGQISSTAQQKDANIKSHISWNPKASSYGGNSTVSLGHELAHSYDRFNGITDLKRNGPGFDVSHAEAFATHVENKIRSSLGIVLRGYYYPGDDGPSQGKLTKGRQSVYFDDKERYVGKDKKNRPNPNPSPYVYAKNKGR